MLFQSFFDVSFSIFSLSMFCLFHVFVVLCFVVLCFVIDPDIQCRPCTLKDYGTSAGYLRLLVLLA